MQHRLHISPDWRDKANRYLKILHELLEGEHAETIVDKSNQFASDLKTHYGDDTCYGFLMWRVITFEPIRFYRDSSDAPTSFDFEGDHSVAKFIDNLVKDHSPK